LNQEKIKYTIDVVGVVEAEQARVQKKKEVEKAHTNTNTNEKLYSSLFRFRL
jgi:hypothetical protein